MQIDCEGCEWEQYLEWFQDWKDSKVTVRQLLIELHCSPPKTPDFFHKLWDQGYVIFHTKANNRFSKNMEFALIKLHPNFQALLLEKKVMSTKEHFLTIYINSHCIGFREDAFVRIAIAFKENIVYNGGKCNGTKVSNHLLHKKLEDVRNIKTYSGHKRSLHFQNKDINKNFRFCLVMENMKVDGYISEKILNAFLGGCIPIYYGA